MQSASVAGTCCEAEKPSTTTAAHEAATQAATAVEQQQQQGEEQGRAAAMGLVGFDGGEDSLDDDDSGGGGAAAAAAHMVDIRRSKRASGGARGGAPRRARADAAAHFHPAEDLSAPRPRGRRAARRRRALRARRRWRARGRGRRRTLRAELAAATTMEAGRLGAAASPRPPHRARSALALVRLLVRPRALALSEAGASCASKAADSLRFCTSPAANLSHLRVAVAQNETDSLFARRKYWYKPVALLAGQPYSISEGDALPFRLGKRMVAGNEAASAGSASRNGFLVYECAARAMQAAVVRPKGRLASASKAVLRVTATRPCAPDAARWPTSGGMWAFEVIVPISIAIEQQTWMDDPSLASLWLPGSPPGLCKQCALGERTCVQVRTKLMVGQPPPRSGGGAAAHPSHEQQSAADEDDERLQSVPQGEWDFM